MFQENLYLPFLNKDLSFIKQNLESINGILYEPWYICYEIIETTSPKFYHYEKKKSASDCPYRSNCGC
jgi:hypothetical protein